MKPELQSRPKRENKDTIESRNERYHNEFFEQVEENVLEITQELKENFEKNKYDVILSDDVGSRIPTLIFRKIAKELSADDNYPKSYFIAAGNNTVFKDQTNPSSEFEKQRKEVVDFLEEKCKKKDVLVVSEYAHSGETIKNFSDILKKSEAESVDIVLLQKSDVAEENFEKNKKVIEKNSNLYMGSDDVASGFYLSRHSGDMSGVEKDIGELHKGDNLYKKVFPEKKEQDLYKDTVKKTREDVNLVAERVLDSLKK